MALGNSGERVPWGKQPCEDRGAASQRDNLEASGDQTLFVGRSERGIRTVAY